MKKKHRFLSALVAMFTATLSLSRADILLRDQFANGTVANTDSVTGYWTVTKDSLVTVDENVASSGKLRFTTTDSAELRGDVHSAASTDYKFLRPQGITIVLKELDFTNSSLLWVQLGSAAQRNAPNRIVLTVQQNGGLKVASIQNNVEVASNSLSGVTTPPSEVVLFIDDTVIEAVAYYPGATGTNYRKTLTANHGFTTTNWDGPSENGHLYLYWKKDAGVAGATCRVGSYEVFEGKIWKGLNQATDATQSKEYSYMDWTTLNNNGKAFADKSEPGSYTTKYESPTVYDGNVSGKTFILRNQSYNLDWNEAAHTVPVKATTSGWDIKNCDFVYIENVNIKNSDVLTYDTFRITNCKEVYVNNVLITGFAMSYHVRIDGCESVLVENVEIEGRTYSGITGKLAGGIQINNGNTAPVSGGMELQYCVVQHNYIHDFDGIITGYGTLNIDGLLIMSGRNALVFNNTFDHIIQQPGVGADSAMDVSHRRFKVGTPPVPDTVYGTGNVMRVERNFFNDSTFTKIGPGQSEANEIIACNNVFKTTTLIGYHQGYTINLVNNTFVDASTGNSEFHKMWSVNVNSNNVPSKRVFRNNLFHKTSGNVSSVHSTSYTGDKRQFLDLNYNVYLFTAGMTRFYYDSTNAANNVASMAAWTTLYPTQETQSHFYTSGAVFQTATGGTTGFDYQLSAGSLAINAGLYPWKTAPSAKLIVDRDFLGTPRSASAKSVGAFEVTVADIAPAITTVALVNGTVSTAYSQALAATAGNGATVWSLPSGGLPPGLSLSSGGVISGTPTTAGSFSFAIKAADSDGNTTATDEDLETLTLSINGAAGTSTVGVFTSQDIGSPGLVGAGSLNTGTYTIAGGGTDIYGTGDKFRFLHQSLSGDRRIIARVASVQDTDPWAKAGLMFRDGTATGDRNVMFFLSAENGTQLTHRATAAGTTLTDANAPGFFAPYWLKLERHINTFTGWQSPDGVAWYLTGAISTTLNASALVGLAVTSHDDALLNTSTFDNVSVVAAPVFTDASIGTATGSTATTVDYLNDVITMNGAGANLYAGTDGFRFYYVGMTGNATIIAEVNSVQNTNAWAKAGLMIRKGLTATSAHATIDVTPTSGLEFLRRTTDGGGTTDQTLATGSAPRWLKLVRSGDSFTAYHSADGGTWTQVGSAVTIVMGSGTVYVGLISCSHVAGTPSAASFSSVFIK